MLERVGIIGWEKIETTILAALAADQRPLLIGSHGSCKTEGAEIISELLLGNKRDFTFRNYEVPILNPDDLFGYPNPKSLSDGKIEFVDTPFAIWGAKAAIFDEINRANPLVQGKLHEIIRTKRLMGMDTNLEFVFSAVNPPGIYDSSYMGLALASRFVCVQIPDIKDMSRIDHMAVLFESGRNTLSEKDKESIRLQFEKSLKLQITHEQKEDLVHILLKVIGKLAELKVNYSMRQAKSALAMLEAAVALHRVGLGQDLENSMVMADILLATIPEVNDVVAASVDVSAIKNVVFSLVKGFVLKDEITMAKSLPSLLALDYEDKVSWAKAAQKTIMATEDLDELLEGYETLKSSRNSGEHKDKVQFQLINKIIRLKLNTSDSLQESYNHIGRIYKEYGFDRSEEPQYACARIATQ
ncbi:AAA family ATPase [Dethiosulfatarculus sandiegensis]|uniref:ATPase dynein-related AAA domain-containing protein n=1 Tax=Dethiosulfatarculus sandiegensis TaxID=1429043 RepID=A0A0D2JA34_9BACT|nr:AAA family ATPase [Dethiosulfatarculus sandiegensis]KIX12541.1 hypothetical protein X474_18225 [Dethiosulfatarculus sandiegensis]